MTNGITMKKIERAIDNIQATIEFLELSNLDCEDNCNECIYCGCKETLEYLKSLAQSLDIN